MKRNFIACFLLLTSLAAGAKQQGETSMTLPDGNGSSREPVELNRNKRQPLPYKDATLPVETRVEDLLSRMTLYEKIAQLNQYTLGNNDNVNNIDEVVDKIPTRFRVKPAL